MITCKHEKDLNQARRKSHSALMFIVADIILSILVNSVRSSRPAYLADQYGRSVTPIILPSKGTPRPTLHTSLDGTAIPEQSHRRGRPPKDPALRTGPYVVKDERDAAAELKRLQDFKLVIGPSFGPEGTILANEKRRRGFLDDEDFEDIVESDD